ncbi:unnamed protein product [Adineta steineri]|uniref:Uncharacterized protein n=1 Tax=Adineta steineri TaxID=433720 RepID=A0A818VWY2_9BILA|nr:unnamed protein product [Adineta steineri]
MSRPRNHQVTPYYDRDLSIHKPGVIPNSSRIISPITANRHKYELKQRIGPKKTVESWFANHSPDERRTVYSFLDTLHQSDDRSRKEEQRRKSPTRRINTASSHSLQRRTSRDNRISNHDLGEVLETVERFRPSSSVKEKGVQTTSTAFTIPLPDVKNDHKSEENSTVQPENDKASRRYLSHTWRVINPRDDVEKNVRPENNTSSFFNYTKKSYPEYFFIHPDWY